ncbi:MAG: tetratricopeptide repeat protein [Gemmatimonadetes bacterium]|nr:tetratricopeptide repeat protein [Gemmatimonadota bacterium]
MLTLGAVPPPPAARGARPTLDEITALLRGANEYHLAGRVRDAELLLEQALQLAPELPEVLHLAGVMAQRAGRPVEALEYLDRALARYPRLAAAHTDRGDILRGLGRADEALAAYRQSLALWSGSPVAWCHLGHALRELRRPDEALRAYREAVARDPESAEARLHLGIVLTSLGDHAEGLEALEAAVRIAPESAAASDHLGVALQRAGRLDEALEAFRRAVALDPRHPAACCHLGAALVEGGQYEQAADALQAALALDPDAPDAHNAMGRVRQGLGYLDQALSAYRQALAIRPDYAEAHLNLGALLDELGRPVEALASCRASLTFRPDCAAAYRRMGGVLRQLDRRAEAVTACRRALELAPDLAPAWTELGDVLRELGRFPEAIAAYDEAIARDPAGACARWRRGLAHLALGHYAAGWEGYEWRWGAAEAGLEERAFTAPRWAGEPLAGRTILVYAEAGPGETLQFARYLPLLAARGGRVVLECAPSLRRLLEGLPCVAQAIAAGEALPTVDYQLPFGSLPAALDEGVDALAGTVPYLPTRIWSARVPLLPPGEGLRVGLALGADAAGERLSPAGLGALLGTPGVTWYQLDAGAWPVSEGALAAVPVHALAPLIRDAADAAPLLGQLDLVITADPVVAHLAGGLAIPAWVVTDPVPEWAFCGEGSRSAWYPEARVFPRSRMSEWGAVVDQVRAGLLEIVRG